MRLTELENGSTTVILDITAKDSNKLQKLIHLGIIPGKEIRLIQKFPTYLVKLNHSLLTIDKELASEIVVKQ